MSSTGYSKTQSAAKITGREPASDQQSETSLDVKNIWQHPYVDVFKHFKIVPTQDWKLNKKQGDVTEIFAKEIGRKTIFLNGNISANNYVQIPHPNSGIKTLGLTGRYVYLQVKAPVSSAPFSFHLDLQLAERSHGIRISCSNLYKTMSTQNGFSLQVPLNLDMNRWSVVVLDIYELLKISGLLPPNYMIQNCYQVKSLMMCACSVFRGIYTSENLYDFVTLPPDMRFKFSFHISKWPEQFAWIELPSDLKLDANESELQLQRIEQTKARAALVSQNQDNSLSNRQKEKMESEINEMLDAKRQAYMNPAQVDSKPVSNQKKLQELQDSLNMQKHINSGNDLLTEDEQLGFKNTSAPGAYSNNTPNDQSRGTGALPYQTGQYVGADNRRSQKLNLDPVLELKHVIGYSPQKCLNLKWSRVPGENVLLFTSGGTLIAMDVETGEQKRFFFGHSSPICCFDVANHGGMVASAQEGKNSIIRIWDYYTARCISMVTMPVTSLKCVAFSPDGRYLASVGKDVHNKEMITIWDISKIMRGEKPEIAAKQTSEFNILCIKFSPIDNCRLVSCGKENIRFWRVRETANIRGSAVVLNHHARNTVFTALDFEWGARSTASYGALNPASRENESLKRLFVASKHGMVFQINYATEALEATYRTNESAIYTIAVNEAFCVTGSEDQYMRVWPLDFSEFFMEAAHEGTVCQVDISNDGLSIVCGTLEGSLGILDKSNLRYKSLLSSHKSTILSMDFQVPKKSIITVSSDNTIRLWDIEKYDQAVEFSSKIDQPLCVASHPTLPIFSCGFESGTMRVFDIEKTCLADEFTQFNKPVRKIAYSPNGDILVTVCEDGSVALHSPRRQHLPTKMMHLEFAPKHIHVAFSPIIRKSMTRLYKPHNDSENGMLELQENRNFQNMDDSSQQHSPGSEEDEECSRTENQTAEETFQVHESFFGIMGEYGNNMMVYDTESIILKHQIQAGHVLKSFNFTKNAQEAILVTADLRIRFYGLSKFEGVYLRELATVHRGSINTTDLSSNGGFMLTGGDDNLIKVWDYDAQKTVPYYFQAFIGHTYPITDLMFNPCDNNTIISTAGEDGIYIWQFHGDTQTNYFPQECEDEAQETANQLQQINERHMMHQPTTLEKMRMSVKEKKKPKLAEFAFIVPPFVPLQEVDFRLNKSLGVYKANQQGFQQYYNHLVQERNLSYNHFITMRDKKTFEVEVEEKALPFDQPQGLDKAIEPTIVNGYDGFGGVHDNLMWNANQGTIVYTLNNKLIQEDTKTRKQTIFAESTVRLSCIAQTTDGKYCAAAEGEQNSNGVSLIYVFDMDGKKFLKQLTFHHKGVQSLCFPNKNNLISLGVAEENCIVVWNHMSCQVLASFRFEGRFTSQIIMDPRNKDLISQNFIEFCTVGSDAQLTFMRYYDETNDLQMSEAQTQQYPQLQDTDFISAAFTPVFPGSESPLLIIGTNDGNVVVFDPDQEEFMNFGMKTPCLKCQIGHIIIKNNYVVLAGSNGSILKYPISVNKILPPEDPNLCCLQNAEAGITALMMDDMNMEGILGTTLGNIYYVNLANNPEERQLIRLVSRAAPGLDTISMVRFDNTNQAVFLSTSGQYSGEVKLFTTGTLDQVTNFAQDTISPVRFFCGYQSNKQKKFRLIGHALGELKLVTLDALKVESMFKMELQQGEELTTGAFNPNGMNFAVGTSFGTVYFGQFKKDNQTRNQVVRLARLTGLAKTEENAVTSIQLSNFNPDGCLLVAFDNGQVRIWQSTQGSQGDDKPATRNNRNTRKFVDIGDLGPVQFNIIDKYDMFQNPHGMDSQYGEEEDMNSELYQGVTCSQCEAIFAPGNNALDQYFAYVGSLQYLFLRNYTHHETVRRINLSAFPTSLQLVDYSKCAQELDLTMGIKGGGLQALVAVGTREGRAQVYKVDNNDSKAICKTKSGMVFGAVSSLCITDNGFTMIVSSESGEVMSYDLKEAIKEKAD